MSSWFGYNTFEDNATFRAHVDRLQPSGLLFLDGDGGGADASRRLPNTTVICRVVNDSYEKEMHRTPGEVLRYVQRRANEVDPACVINLGCEPPKDDLDVLAFEYLKALRWAVANNRKATAAHFAHYGFGDREYEQILPLAKYIAEHPDYLSLSLDSYYAGVPFSGVQDTRFPPDAQRGHIDPASWLPSNLNHYDHIGREFRLFEMMQAQGLPLPVTWITEGGADDLGDVQAWRESLIHHPDWPYIKGFRSLEYQYAEWAKQFGLSDWIEYYVRGLESIRDQIYSQWPNVKGYLLYVWGNNGDRLWTSQNHDHPDFMARIERTNVKEKPPVSNPKDPNPVPLPATEPIGMKMTKANGAYANVRSRPTTIGSVVRGRVSPGDVVDGWPNDIQNGYLAIRKADVEGWVSLQGGKVAFESVGAVPPLRFGQPLDKPWIYGNLFDHPRPTYATLFPDKLPKHEGLDIKRAPGVLGDVQVLAVQTGKILANGPDDDGYGWFVKQEVVWYGKVYHVYYGHLKAKSPLQIGATVTIGEIIGVMGNTGQSSAEHLHLTVAVPSEPNNYVVSGAINPMPFMPEPTGTEEPEEPEEPEIDIKIIVTTALAKIAEGEALIAQAKAMLAEAEADGGDLIREGKAMLMGLT